MRRDREPALIIRSPSVDVAGGATLYSWVPKAAFELRLIDDTGSAWLGSDLTIVSMRSVPIIELAIRAFFRFPRKLAAVAALWRKGNHRGVAFRFARLADEINAMPYSQWLARHRRAMPELGELPSRADILVTLEDPDGPFAPRTLASLDQQVGIGHWRVVSRRELADIRAAMSAEGSREPDNTVLWLNLPAGAILANDAMQRLTSVFSAPEVVAAYCDEDEVDHRNMRHSPVFKPAWTLSWQGLVDWLSIAPCFGWQRSLSK